MKKHGIKRLLAAVLVLCLLASMTVALAAEPSYFLALSLTESRRGRRMLVNSAPELTADTPFVPALFAALSADTEMLEMFHSPGLTRILTDGAAISAGEDAQKWTDYLAAYFAGDTGELKGLLADQKITVGKITPRKHYSVTFVNTIKGDRTYTTSYTLDVTMYKPGHVDANPIANGLSQLLLTDDHIAFMNGDENGNFDATRQMTRKETAQIFYNLLRSKEVETTVTFPDVAADAWYAPAVNAMAALGILKGDGQGNFRPDDLITRAEFVSVAARMAKSVEGSHNFSDLAPAAWAEKDIATAVAYGWIDGYEDGTFRPMEPINRAQAATVVCRMLQRQPDKAYIDANPKTVKGFADVNKGHWYYYTVLEAAVGHTCERAPSDDETWTGLK